MKLVTFFTTTIGQKILVALTGIFMIFFLLMHLLGNLEIFSGPDAVNGYAAFLRTMPKTLWAFRLALIAAVCTHIALTISLTRKNQHARPHQYHNKKSRKASISSRTMMISGLTVLAFIAYHLAHYTFGIADPALMKLIDSHGRHHVYNMMVMGFSHPLVSGFYLIAQILLAGNLSHGISSSVRTLGFEHSAMYEKIRKAGIAFAVIIALLYSSIPISVLFGFITLDT